MARPGAPLLTLLPARIGAPPLDPLMIDYWHSELGISLVGGTVDSWKGQIGGRVVPYTTARPAYGPDGANFNGRKVVQCSLTASLFAASLPTFIALGSRPYFASIFRFRSVPGSATYFAVIDVGVNAVSDNFYLRGNCAGGPPGFYELYTAAVNTVVKTPIDTVVHRWEAWGDGVNLNNRFDGTLVQTPTAASVTHNVTSIGIGNAAGGAGVHRSDTSHAFHAMFSAKPSDTYLASLRSWAASYWGTVP